MDLQSASALMNPTPVTVGPELSLAALVALWLDVGTDAAVVVSDEVLVGVISSRHLALHPDLRAALQQRQSPDVRVRALMVQVTPVSPHTTAQEVLEQLYLGEAGCVPVVASDRVVGLVTRRSVVSSLAGQSSEARIHK